MKLRSSLYGSCYNSWIENQPADRAFLIKQITNWIYKVVVNNTNKKKTVYL